MISQCQQRKICGTEYWHVNWDKFIINNTNIQKPNFIIKENFIQKQKENAYFDVKITIEKEDPKPFQKKYLYYYSPQEWFSHTIAS